MQSEGPREPSARSLGDSDSQDAAVRERVTGTALCDNRSKSDHHAHFTAEGTEARQACWGQEPCHQGEPCPNRTRRGGFWRPLSPSWVRAPNARCPEPWRGEGFVSPPPGTGQLEVTREVTW